MEKNMISFKNWLKNSRKQNIREALTIPADKAGEIEKKLRTKLEDKEFKQRYPKFQYHDIIVKCCRHDEKTGNPKDVERTYIMGLPNIMDMFDVYEKTKQTYKIQHMTKHVPVIRRDGKEIQLDPVKDIGKIGKLDILKQFIDSFDKLVNSDDLIPTTFEKYAIADEDRKCIRLICWNDNVMVWGTRKFEPSQKFAVQLWQNIDTIDSAGEYGHPERQCPYCTHARSHWDNHAGNNDNYEQFWYLVIPENYGSLVKGDLTNSAVVRLYNKLKGLGPDILCAQNDSDGDWCDRDDTPIAEYDVDIQDISDEDEGIEIQTDSDSGEDEDEYETVEVNFNGHLEDVQKIDEEFFTNTHPLTYRRQAWENDSDFKYRIARNNAKGVVVTPVGEAPEQYKDFDIEHDIWDDKIVIGEDNVDVVDGRSVLKMRYPKSVKEILVRNVKLDSFKDFPNSVTTGYISFEKCRIENFDDFPILNSNQIYKFLFKNCVVGKYNFFSKVGENNVCTATINQTDDGVIRLSTDGNKFDNISQLRITGYSKKNQKLDISDFYVDKIDYLYIEDIQDIEQCDYVLKTDQMFLDGRLFKHNLKCFHSAKKLDIDLRNVSNLASMLKNILINGQQLVDNKSGFNLLHQAWRSLKITSIDQLDGLPYNNAIASTMYPVGETNKQEEELQILVRLYQQQVRDAFDENGYFDHRRIDYFKYDSIQKYKCIMLECHEYNLDMLKTCSIIDNRLKFFDKFGKSIYVEDLMPVKINFNFNFPQDEAIQKYFQNILKNRDFKLKLNSVEIGGDGIDLSDVDLVRLLIQSDSNEKQQIIKLDHCQIKKLADYSSSNIIYILNSAIDFAFFKSNMQSSKYYIENSDIHTEIDAYYPDNVYFKNSRIICKSFRLYPYLNSDDKYMPVVLPPADNIFQGKCILKIKDRYLKNSNGLSFDRLQSCRISNLKIRLESEKQLQNILFDISQVNNENISGKIDAIVSSTEFDTCQKISFKLSCPNIDLKFINDIKSIKNFKSIELDFTQHYACEKIDFDNVFGLKTIFFEGHLPKQLTLIGMPYFEELDVRYAYLTDSVKDELKKYFVKISNTQYKIKKEFVDSNNRLNPNIINENISGMPGWNRDDLKNEIVDFINDRITEYRLDMDIKDIALHGSRVRGDFRGDSDLDVVLYYEGSEREDHAFNMLNDEPCCEIDGIVVDINPIRDEETGSLADYMKRDTQYDREKISNMHESYNIDNIKYIALKLDEQSKRRLKEIAQNEFGDYDKIYCDHLTLAYGEDQIQTFDMDLIGERTQFEIWNIIYDDKAVAASIDLDSVRHLDVNNDYPHITMAVKNGVRPVYSNQLISGFFNRMNDANIIQFEMPVIVRGKVELVF